MYPGKKNEGKETNYRRDIINGLSRHPGQFHTEARIQPELSPTIRLFLIDSDNNEVRSDGSTSEVLTRWVLRCG